jgi:aspartate carbamoyltransferase catalytic subunit
MRMCRLKDCGMCAEKKGAGTLVSPEILRLPLDIMNEVRARNLPVRETYDVADVIETADVLYVTRVQKERFSDLSEYEEVKGCYEITPELMKRAKEKMIVMHPLPRVGRSIITP